MLSKTEKPLMRLSAVTGLLFALCGNHGLAEEAKHLVQLDSGVVQGHVHAGPEPSLEFLGIPYGADTGGENRFRGPQAVPPWEGVYMADQVGPDCVANRPDSPDGRITPAREPNINNQSEDCLYLNLWTPALDDGKRPVLVWLHGGGLRFGTYNKIGFTGNHLAARHNLVVTAINYRLGAAGMMTHPALVDEDTGYIGNWNIQDWLAMARWVKQNIAAFGGDPDNIIFFGESGGSVGVNDLAMVNPEIRAGLVHKVIGQSGDPSISTMARHTEEAEEFFRNVGCGDINEPGSLACVRNLSQEEFHAGFAEFSAWPAHDGKLIRYADPVAAANAGETIGIDIVTGENGPRDVATEVSWNFLMAHNAQGSGRGYRYYMTDSSGVTARHVAEIRLVWGTWEDGYSFGDNSDPNVKFLSNHWMQSWANFAHSGDPSFESETLGNIDWPIFEAGDHQTMIWGAPPRVEAMTPE